MRLKMPYKPWIGHRHQPLGRFFHNFCQTPKKRWVLLVFEGGEPTFFRSDLEDSGMFYSKFSHDAKQMFLMIVGWLCVSLSLITMRSCWRQCTTKIIRYIHGRACTLQWNTIQLSLYHSFCFFLQKQSSVAFSCVTDIYITTFFFNLISTVNDTFHEHPTCLKKYTLYKKKYIYIYPKGTHQGIKWSCLLYDLPSKKTPNRLDTLLPKRGNFTIVEINPGLDAFNDGPLCWA